MVSSRGTAAQWERKHYSLHSREMRPASWTKVPTPSRMRMCVQPISCQMTRDSHIREDGNKRGIELGLTRMNSSLVTSCSL